MDWTDEEAADEEAADEETAASMDWTDEEAADEEAADEEAADEEAADEGEVINANTADTADAISAWHSTDSSSEIVGIARRESAVKADSK